MAVQGKRRGAQGHHPGKKGDPPEVSKDPGEEVAAVAASGKLFNKTIGEEADKARSPLGQRSETSLLVPPGMKAQKATQTEMFPEDDEAEAALATLRCPRLELRHRPACIVGVQVVTEVA